LSKFVQPYFTAPAPPSTQEPGEETPLLQPTATEPDSTSKSPTTNTHKSTRYDYFLWLLCLAIEVVGYTLLGSNAASNAALYVFASGLHAFAAPLDSVFLGLTLALKPSDVPSGKLFGALGVIDALALSFLSAPLWTAVFTATVDTYPPAMFLVAAGMLTLVGLLGFCVKIKGSV
jgi:hypothetical protein